MSVQRQVRGSSHRERAIAFEEQALAALDADHRSADFNQ
jgi:hypothetical protein